MLLLNSKLLARTRCTSSGSMVDFKHSIQHRVQIHSYCIIAWKARSFSNIDTGDAGTRTLSHWPFALSGFVGLFIRLSHSIVIDRTRWAVLWFYLGFSLCASWKLLLHFLNSITFVFDSLYESSVTFRLSLLAHHRIDISTISSLLISHQQLAWRRWRAESVSHHIII
jgi:hypothetical protein